MRYRFVWSLHDRHLWCSTIMTSKDQINLSREELYKLVRAEPMTEVGQDFQISERAMVKICNRKQVPVPPRGYWAKKNAGKSVAKPQLPEFSLKPLKESNSRVTPTRQTPEKRSRLASSYYFLN